MVVDVSGGNTPTWEDWQEVTRREAREDALAKATPEEQKKLKKKWHDQDIADGKKPHYLTDEELKQELKGTQLRQEQSNELTELLKALPTEDEVAAKWRQEHKSTASVEEIKAAIGKKDDDLVKKMKQYDKEHNIDEDKLGHLSVEQAAAVYPERAAYLKAQQQQIEASLEKELHGKPGGQNFAEIWDTLYAGKQESSQSQSQGSAQEKTGIPTSTVSENTGQASGNAGDAVDSHKKDSDVEKLQLILAADGHLHNWNKYKDDGHMGAKTIQDDKEDGGKYVNADGSINREAIREAFKEHFGNTATVNVAEAQLQTPSHAPKDTRPQEEVRTV